MSTQTPRSRSPMQRGSQRYQTDYVRLITQQIDSLGKLVQEYLCQQCNSSYSTEVEELKQQLYSTTFNIIFETLQQSQRISKNLFDSDNSCTQRITYKQPNDDVSAMAEQLRFYLQEFRRETLELVAARPFMSLFDFVLSQQFNDLWNILVVCQEQLEPFDRSLELMSVQNRVRRRSKSEVRRAKVVVPAADPYDALAPPPSDFREIEFVLMQQLVAEMQGGSRDNKLIAMARRNDVSDTFSSPSPPQVKKHHSDLPQLFSFDSSFVKDLPLSRHPYTSNFDQDTMTMTMGGGQLHGTLANISGIVREEEEFGFSYLSTKDQPTSRFEPDDKHDTCQSDMKRLQRDGSQRSLQSQLRRGEERTKQVEDREKEIATKELMILVKEKQLLQLKEQLTQEQAHLKQQYQLFESERTAFYVYREEELSRLQQNAQSLESLERQLLVKEALRSKEIAGFKKKENLAINQQQLMKGHLKSLVERMRK